MSQNKSVAFIVGGGPRVGYAVAEAFTKRGYKVAIASRRPDRSEAEKQGWLAVEMDVSNQESVKRGFETVRSQLGFPTVVVYNTAALTFAAANDPFGLTCDQYLADLHINLTGAYQCLHESVAAWNADEFSKQPPKVFIATGNVVPFQPVPFAVTLGSGKAALAHLIQVGNMSYEKQGFRFYFASQVTEDGGPVPYQDVDAEAHGRRYTELVDRVELGDWDVRFVH